MTLTPPFTTGESDFVKARSPVFGSYAHLESLILDEVIHVDASPKNRIYEPVELCGHYSIMSGTEASRTPHVSSGSETVPVSPEDKQQATGDSILGRKLKKILESDLETDSETAQALDELSIFITDNSLHTRRFLRGEIERRSLQGYHN